MLFNFRLRPLGEIVPWPAVHSLTTKIPDWLQHDHLHWFGLTDGWYWLDVGQSELFRYGEVLIEQWKRQYAGALWLNALPYVDYQVARLWEDVLDILPAALDPIPSELAHLVGPDGPWNKWERQARIAVEEALPRLEAWDLLEDAVGWRWKRMLDTLYLQAGPQIWFWTYNAETHIEWDNRDCILDGYPAWETALGQHLLPTAAFIEEVRAFDTRFIRRMRDRIAIAQAEWSRPEVALDPELATEHAGRSRRLQQSLEGKIRWEPDRWNGVIQAIAVIETLSTFRGDKIVRLVG